MDTALYLGAGSKLASSLPDAFRRANWQVETTQDLGAFRRLVGKNPDVAVIDLAAGGQELISLRRTFPAVPVMCVTTNYDQLAESAIAEAVIEDPLVEYVTEPIRVDEVVRRIQRLLKLKERWQPEEPEFRIEIGTDHLVPQIHAADSGRIDAREVADLYGMPLAKLARILGKGRSTVHKTPDAPALQPRLGVFERIAAGLLKQTGSPEALRSWLNAPNRELDNETPMALLETGAEGVVANLVEDALYGHPS